MKRITLKRMTLKNFKGVRSLEIDFGSTTSVYGRNGTGKTTIYDAFTWVLFNKNGRDSQFQPATYDENGTIIPRMEHEVSIILDVDGAETRLTKRIADKWVTKRGTTTPKLDKWENSYFLNDVPCREKDFKAFVDTICGYETFKIVTKPSYFMTLQTDKRKALLLNMAGGDITPNDVIGADSDLEDIVRILDNKTYEELNKQLKAEKLRYTKERDRLEGIIADDNNKVRRDLPTIEEVEQRIHEKESQITGIDSLIADRTSSLKAAQEHNRQRQADILKASNELHNLINKKVSDVQLHRSGLESKIREYELKTLGIQNQINMLKTQSEAQLAIFEEKKRIREEFKNQLKLANAEVFTIKEDDICCPTCGRMFEGNMLSQKQDELKNQFYERKARRLTEIQQKGKANSALMEKANEENARIFSTISSLKESASKIDDEISQLRKALEETIIPTEEYLMGADTDVISLAQKRDRLCESAESELPTIDVSDLQNEQKALRSELGGLNQLIAEVKRNEQDKSSILAMEERYSEIVNEIAQIELKQDKMIRYSRKRAEMLAEKVNRMFKLCRFKFLEEQMNEGINDNYCEPWIDGTPYSTNLNNGSRTNADIDICNAFGTYYGILAPIFVDNAESTNTLMPTDTQMVRLVVSEDEKLRIESNR